MKRSRLASLLGTVSLGLIINSFIFNIFTKSSFVFSVGIVYVEILIWGILFAYFEIHTSKRDARFSNVPIARWLFIFYGTVSLVTWINHFGRQLVLQSILGIIIKILWIFSALLGFVAAIVYRADKEKPKQEYIYRIAFLGGLYSGKDDFTHLLALEKYTEDIITIHDLYGKLKDTIDFYPMVFSYQGISFKYLFLDIPDDSLSYLCRGAHGAIILFNVNKIQSYKRLKKNIRVIRRNTYKIPIILIGNTCDVVENDTVQRNIGMEIVKKYDLTYIEINTTTGENLEKPFEILADNFLKRLEQ
ncbi:MAG: hypothetical protein ACFFDF_25490 [Candidatus Odinarchaeota archaeon]